VGRPVAARAAAVVVAVAVLCSFSAVLVAAEEEADEPADPAEQAVNTNAGAREGAASQLSIGTGPEDSFPFGSEAGASQGAAGTDEVLFEGGAATARFSCGGHAALAIEQPNVAVRRLGIWMAAEAVGMLDNLVGGNSDNAERPDVWVTDGQLRVFSEDGTQGSPVLFAALDSQLPNGTKIQAGDEQNRNKELTVQYDCRQEGKAVVELRLRAESDDKSSGSVCLRWVKQCVIGWSSMTIEQDDTIVVTDGKIQDDWLQRMTSEGTNRQAVKFTLSAEGLELIRKPTVSSDQKLVSAELLGPLAYPRNEKSEISRDSVDLTVSFNCLFDGHAFITLVIEKDTFSGDEPERLVLKFRKVCGTEAYQHLDVFVKSEKYKNRTKAYSQGAVVRGFGRPCKGSESQALALPSPHQEQAQAETCHQGAPALVVSEEELRTVLELEIDKFGNSEPPKFEPLPDITYDNKVLRVQVLQSPSATPLGNRKSGKRHGVANRRQVLSLKYTCFKDGESMIMVTMHVLAHNSINLAWKKRCVEPKVKAGKAFTAPQAIMVTMFCIGVVVVLGLVCYVYSDSSKETEEPKSQKKAYRHVDEDEENGGSNLEMTKAIGNQEVVYHS